MPKMRFSISGLDEHASALGYLCFYSADMEHFIDDFIRSILDCGEDIGRVVTQSAGQASGRSELLKMLLYASPISNAHTPDGDSWITIADKLLTYIVKTIFAQRNRLVHDRWNVLSATQTDVRIGVKKQQSHHPKALTKPIITARDVDETWLLVFEFSYAMQFLGILKDEFEDWTRTGSLPQSHEPLVRWSTQGDPRPIREFLAV